MMSKLTAQGISQNKLFKPKIYQGKSRGQARNYYNQNRYQSRYRSNSGDKKMSYRGGAQYGQHYTGDFRKGNFRRMLNYRGQNFRGGYRGNFRNDNFGKGRCRSTERKYSINFRRNYRSSSRSKSGSRASTNRDRIRCFKCREYDYFAKDCLNISDTEKEKSGQIQQMLNLQEDKAALKVIMADTYENLITAQKRLQII